MEACIQFKMWLMRLLGVKKPGGDTETADIGQKSFCRFVPLIAWVSVPVFFYLLWIFAFWAKPFLQETSVKILHPLEYPELINQAKPSNSSFIAAIKSRVNKLDKSYAKFSNRQPYMIVNTSDNTFTLFNNGKLVREGLCSTGSFVLLDAGGEQKWMFETPKGMKRIQGKTQSPVWRKPDWAFIEEGLPVPKHANSFERYEYGVLGDYALSIGNGYLIHGTLYQRLLGMPVTHGCIRLGDADLKQVFQTLMVGSKVYIF